MNKIPCFIINYNLFTWTKNIFEYLFNVEELFPIIIDNNSNYIPLLNYYKSIPKENIIYMSKNFGHKVVWLNEIQLKYNNEYYCVTDPDLDLSNIKKDFVEKFKKKFLEDEKIFKVGFSLELNDLPQSQLGKDVKEWEIRFQQNIYDEEYFWASIDTTFALYKKDREYLTKRTGKMLRSKYYVARHLPWYIDINNIDEEYKYYLMNLNLKTGHWSHYIEHKRKRIIYENT